MTSPQSRLGPPHPQTPLSRERLTSRIAPEVLWQRAFSAARGHGANREDAEDIASATVEKYLATRNSVSRPEPWTRTVVRRRWWRLVLCRRREVTLSVEHDQVAAVVEDSRGFDLRRLVGRLSRRDRLLVTLAAAGTSHEEIGRRAGLRTGAVGAYLARAIARARRLVVLGAQAQLIGDWKNAIPIR